MTAHPRPNLVAEQVSCDICHKEVPLSEANHFEAQDYIAHFCGLDCYSEWKQRSEALERQRQINKG